MQLSEIREIQENLEYEYYRMLFTALNKEDILKYKQRLEAEIDFALEAYYNADTEKENIAWDTYVSVKTLHHIALKVIDDIMGNKISQYATEFYNAKTGAITIHFNKEGDE